MPSYKRKNALPAWGLYDKRDGSLKATLKAVDEDAAMRDFILWGPKYNWYGLERQLFYTELRRMEDS